MALARLEAADRSKIDDEAAEPIEEAAPQLLLHDERLDSVATELDLSGATSVASTDSIAGGSVMRGQCRGLTQCDGTGSTEGVQPSGIDV